LGSIFAWAAIFFGFVLFLIPYMFRWISDFPAEKIGRAIGVWLNASANDCEDRFEH